MSQSRHEDIEKRLRETEAPSPPADLLDRLRDGIPERPTVVRLRGDTDGESGETADPTGRRRWLIAASVAVALIGGSVAWQVAQRASRPGAGAVGEARLQDAERVPEAAPRTPEPAPGELEEGHIRFSRPNQQRKRPPPPVAALEDVAGATRVQVPQARDSISIIGESHPVEGQAESSAYGEAPSLPDPSVVRPPAPGSAPPPSTGGTAEPNDQVFGDMFFRSYGVNPFIDTEDDNLSTFGLDVDTGSYTMARSYLERGHLPPPEAIRVEEMVNFFDYGDPAPSGGHFAITAEGAPTPFADGSRYRLLRFAVRGREVQAADRSPADLVFVVDVSGSMGRENRLGTVRKSLGLLLGELRSDDRVGLVVYGDRGRVLLEPSGDLERIRTAIERLRPGGSTNAEEGLALGYEMAERHFRDGAINRIVLCSDGVANVGRTGPDSILERIGAAAERGIELTTVGFGMGNYNDVLMEQLADRGDGGYAYVDSLDEARRVFVEELTGTLQTIAREAKIQVEFNPEAVSRYRLLGYENRDIADERFRDDTVDAGEIGAGHSVTALYEIKLHEDVGADDELATLRLRFEPVRDEFAADERSPEKLAPEVIETSRSLRAGELADSWESASTGLRLASLVAEYAEILRGSYWARGGDLEDVFRRAQALSAELAGDVEVAELAGLIGRASRLAPQEAPALALEDQ